MKHLFAFLLALLSCNFIFTNSIFADEYIFNEEFNENRATNTIDGSKWNFNPYSNSNFETIKETNGVIDLKQQDNTHQYPAVWTKNLNIPEDKDYQVEIRFKFSNTGEQFFYRNPCCIHQLVRYWDSVIRLTDQIPNSYGDEPNAILRFGITQAFGGPFIDSIFNNGTMNKNGLDIGNFGDRFYVLKIDKKDKIYKLYLDNQLFFTSSPINEKINYIFFGAGLDPSYVVPNNFTRTKLTVDYVRIKEIPKPKTPVLFIPGIGGSELKANSDIHWSADNGHGGIYTRNYLSNEKVWVNLTEATNILTPSDDYFDILRMKPDGLNSEADIGITGNLYEGTYQSAINFFLSNGYILNQDFFIFPYDWRKELSQSTPLLDIKVKNILQQTGSNKIDVVAHSMGGLVARNYIDYKKNQNGTNNTLPVRKFIELGVPHLGSVDAIKNLIYGSCLTKESLKNLSICIGITNSEVKDITHNMLSIYQLLPTSTYTNFYPTGMEPFIDINDTNHDGITEAISQVKLDSFLNSLGFNLSLSPNINNLPAQTRYDNNNQIETSIISGSGKNTLGQIIEGYKTSLLGVKKPATDLKNINGDGTVPLFSASLEDQERNIYLKGNAKVFYTNQTHGELVTNGPALNLVKNILNDVPNLPTGVSTKPFKFKGKLLGVFSPIQIHAYDNQGNHTGILPNGDYETNIPGSTFETLGESKFIFLPEDGIYKIKFEATDQGAFDFKITNYSDDLINKTTLYQDVPLTKDTKGDVTLDTSKNISPALNMDNDGNGTTDKIIKPTSITGLPDDTADNIPPTTNINLNGTLGSGIWYRSDVIVSLSSQDNIGGSGINKIEYSLDLGKTYQEYTVPFTITTEGLTLLKYRAIDYSGNREPLKEKAMQIDKTIPEAKIYLDLDTQQLKVIAVDNSSATAIPSTNTNTNKRDDVIYTITDVSGNSVIIDIRDKTSNSFRIFSLKYNNATSIVLNSNKISIIYSKNPKILTNIQEQNFEILGDPQIKIKYDKLTNKSSIYTKEFGLDKLKEVKNGISVLNVNTNKGVLNFTY